MKKSVLITGGGKRIGAALVRKFAELEFAVYIHVNQSRQAAEELRKELKNPACHHIVECDLSDPAARRNMIDTLPAMDLVINNASVYRLTPPGNRETAENRERYWQVNYNAPLEIITHQQTAARGRKTVAITVLDCDVLNPDGGIKIFEPVPEGVDSYLATRIALAHKIVELARTAAPLQRLAAIAPGPVLPPVNCTAKGMTIILERVVTGEPVGVQEVVNTAVFLWQNPSLTGVIIPVDGGMHLNQGAIFIQK